MDLSADPEVLLALAAGLARYGPAEGSENWFCAFAWLCTSDQDFIVSSDSNGALRIAAVDVFLSRLREERAAVGDDLPEVPDTLLPPQSLRGWDPGDTALAVLDDDGIKSGLLFSDADGRQFLIASQQGLGVTLSEDRDAINEFSRPYSRLSVQDYAAQIRR